MMLSLEPLSHALSAVEAELEASRTSKDTSLSFRLQRLWQERGDFSKLNTAVLEEEAAREQDLTDKDPLGDSAPEASTSKGATSGDDQDEASGAAQSEQEELEQTLTPEQLWELKSNILEGLDLARVDITSALDLLQLYLNPLQALNPPVPDEALALPPGSFSATSLPTPLLPPTEHNRVQDVALSFSTKLKAVDTASKVFRSASKRLSRTTDQSQSEWTDLLRLKRAGEWRIEARASSSTGHPASSLTDYSANAQIDKLAKDVCIFCGIEEATVQWRHAGMARLKDRKGKGKETENQSDRIDVPERLEGRRRLVLKLKMRDEEEAYIAWPLSPYTPDKDSAQQDINSSLAQAQRELFEEEIFAQIVQEARESTFKIKATRSSVTISSSDAFSLQAEMVPIDEIADRINAEPPSSLLPLVKLLLPLCRLQMIRIYKHRRRDLVSRPAPQVQSSASTKTAKQQKQNITTSLMHIVSYYLFVTAIQRLLESAIRAVASLQLDVDGASAFELDFAPVLSSAPDLLASLEAAETRLGGVATLILGKHSVDLSFQPPSNIALHLKAKVIHLTSVDQLTFVLQPALRAAVVEQCHRVLERVIEDCSNGKEWEVLPLPNTIEQTTNVLARKQSKTKQVNAFISISPQVRLQNGRVPECEVKLACVHSKREHGASTRRMFESSKDDSNGLSSARPDGAKALHLIDWLREVLKE